MNVKSILVAVAATTLVASSAFAADLATKEVAKDAKAAVTKEVVTTKEVVATKEVAKDAKAEVAKEELSKEAKDAAKAAPAAAKTDSKAAAH